jgi:hypothetical protein
MSDAPFDIKDFRQPLVTSLGVILGFLLGFLGQWVTEDAFELRGASDSITFVGCIVGSLMLLTALIRMLSPGVTPELATTFYRNTLRIFIVGVVLPLRSIVVSAFI